MITITLEFTEKQIEDFRDAMLKVHDLKVKDAPGLLKAMLKFETEDLTTFTEIHGDGSEYVENLKQYVE